LQNCRLSIRRNSSKTTATRTKTAARDALAELMKKSTPRTQMTFTELAERWGKAEGPTIKPSTFAHYQSALRAYVTPTFGTRQIATINREEIQKILTLKSQTYSRSSLRSMKVVLGLTLG
jgi:hypothetical protein